MCSVVSRCIDKKQLEKVLFVAAIGLLIGIPGSVGAMGTKIEKKTTALAKLLENQKFAECSQGKFPKLNTDEIKTIKKTCSVIEKEYKDAIYHGGDFIDLSDMETAAKHLKTMINEKKDQQKRAKALRSYLELMKDFVEPPAYGSSNI